VPEIELFADVVTTLFGQFDIGWSECSGFDGNDTAFFEGQVNGLVGAARDDGVYLHLARSEGSLVRINLLDAEPPPPTEWWEDVVEVSVVVPDDAAVRWMTWARESHGVLEGLTPGSYRLRVSARGRDLAAANQSQRGVVDSYLLEFWRAQWEPDQIIRTGSANAVYWHRAFGSRR
jgi:hypothetical protein